MTSPTTEVLEQPTDTTSDDTPKLFHYVRKAKIAESAVMGNHVVALCGETFPVTKSAKPGSPVCPDCERIFKQLPPGKD
ncbi:DUF3039 domain-containing protein [Nakamurella lactea]|uniref:DUF3039 domain-containing protein n=1 Tax=Nakamurella lactea TaxID=459515 RepID=UPI00041D45B8|nr:DUF3039 domain-containing protein [Nakamurella lactea]